MKTAVVILAASVAVASATSNATVCTKPGVFCVGESLQTNIYITCNDQLESQTGNCADNLAGVAPESVFGMCYQTSPTAGDAVCEKNCVAGTSTLPASVCTPPSSSSTAATTTEAETTVTTDCSDMTTSTAMGSWTTSATVTVSASSNGTTTTWTAPGGPTTTAATTSVATSVPTAGAAANRVGGVLAAVGMFAAYLL